MVTFLGLKNHTYHSIFWDTLYATVFIIVSNLIIYLKSVMNKNNILLLNAKYHFH